MKSARLSFHVCVSVALALTALSCGNHEIEKEIEAFMSSEVEIPESEMVELHCGLCQDAGDVSPLTVIDYEKVESCSICVASKIAGLERKAFAYKADEPLRVVHIISACYRDSAMIYKDLCRERVRGIVFLDTCNAFLSANPNFRPLLCFKRL